MLSSCVKCHLKWSAKECIDALSTLHIPASTRKIVLGGTDEEECLLPITKSLESLVFWDKCVPTNTIKSYTLYSGASLVSLDLRVCDILSFHRLVSRFFRIVIQAYYSQL